MHIHIITKQKV